MQIPRSCWLLPEVHAVRTQRCMAASHALSVNRAPPSTRDSTDRSDARLIDPRGRSIRVKENSSCPRPVNCLNQGRAISAWSPHSRHGEPLRHFLRPRPHVIQRSHIQERLFRQVIGFAVADGIKRLERVFGCVKLTCLLVNCFGDKKSAIQPERP